MALILCLTFLFFLRGVLGGIICEQLPIGICSYSVSVTGKRCLLENYALSDGTTSYQCKTSEVVVDMIHDWIESDECIHACGVDREAIGISSDLLIQPQFTAKLCSPECYLTCPNIVDLYSNLALGEGVSLATLCEKQRNHPRRAMLSFRSYAAASSPAGSPTSVSSELDCSPVAAPASA